MKQSAISRFEKSDEACWKFETLLKLAEALDAQLVISLIKSEDVTARYERSETGPRTKSSVLDAAANEAKPVDEEYLRPTWSYLYKYTRSDKWRSADQQRHTASAMDKEGRHAWS